jgi:hypothetical protein
MKKFITILIALILVGIYYVSLNSDLMNKISDYRFNLEYFSPDTKFGDLYCFAYNPKIKVPIQKFNLETFQNKNSNQINLYLSCDSYVGVGKTIWLPENLQPKNFKNVNKIEYYRRSIERGFIKLDTTKRNILIYEVVERNVRDMFADTTYFWNERNNLDFSQSEQQKYSSKNTDFFDFIFNKKINQNLEFNLFSNPIFRVFKEWKAYINTDLFHKPNEVVISADGKNMYYAPTIDRALKTSSFNPIDDKELQTLIKNMNSIFSNYKHYGFAEVYISIIPNPVTIIEPHRSVYNDLIQKIQNNKNLKVPYIDCYSVFKKANYQIFMNSDSHWNDKGMQLWINEVNKIFTNE